MQYPIIIFFYTICVCVMDRVETTIHYFGLASKEELSQGVYVYLCNANDNLKKLIF